MHGILKKIVARSEFAGYSAYTRVFDTKLITHKGISFALGTSTANEAHRAFTFSSKEPETLDWVDHFQGPNPVFFDVGANVGIYSLYAQQRWPDGRIFAFEPESQSFAALCRNVYRNCWSGGDATIQPFQIAIAKVSHLGSLTVNSMKAGAGASALDGDYQFFKSKIFRQGVAAYSLDDLVGTHNLPQPNYLKIDVDGLEADILLGAEQVLRSPSLRGLLVEFQYRDEAEVAPQIASLKAMGLILEVRSAWQADYHGLLSRNFIFRRGS